MSFKNGIENGTMFCYFISSLKSREAGDINLLPDNDDVCQTVTTNQIFLKTAVKDSLKTYLPKHVAWKRHSSFQLYFDTASGSINEIEGFMSRLLSD